MKKIAVISLVCLCISNLSAVLVPVSFQRVTNNASDDIAEQLMMNISDNDPVYDAVLGQYVNKVTFMFMNNGPVDSEITEIYFYDGVLLNMYSIDDSCTGVNFENLGESTNPADLPGYDSAPLVVLSATESEQGNKKGVNASEWIKIGYTLKPGKTVDDLLSDLATGEVAVGVHVRSIGSSNTSDSYVSVVPEPATLAMLGLGGLCLLRRRVVR